MVKMDKRQQGAKILISNISEDDQLKIVKEIVSHMKIAKRIAPAIRIVEAKDDCLLNFYQLRALYYRWDGPGIFEEQQKSSKQGSEV